jgi:hypothetical protein
VPALDPLRGLRVVADPASLDTARWTGGRDVAVTVLRLAPDDAFAVGARTVDIDDPHAIVDEEHGFVGGWCSIDHVLQHAEWSVPDDRPSFAQGAIAGVPAKLWLPDDGDALLVTSIAHADVLAERLGWRR